MATEQLVKKVPEAMDVNVAMQQVFLAHERTLLGWIRTATSMITFGIALYEFFFFMHRDKQPTPFEQIFGGRVFGMSMMAIGVFALTFATWQHRQQLRSLRASYPEAPQSMSLVLAAVVAGLGIFGFTSAVFRL
jgi:putative membrane protein